MAKKTYDLLFKLLLIGDSGVGKTSILFRFSDDAYTPTFISTIGIDFKIKTIELKGKKIKLQIWDTAGQERFHTITTSYYRGAMGIMLVYDITNAKSFDNIQKWLRNIDEHANRDVERMIVGNKCDMEDRRIIPKERGEAIAREHGIRFMETSACSNINVEKAFLDLARAILDNQTADQERQESQDKVNIARSDQRSSTKCSTLKMLWLLAPIYVPLIIVSVIQSIHPIFMVFAMMFRQSRLLYSFFHEVDTVSKRHGGELVAQVLKSHGVENIFTLPGGHVSPIVVASNKLDIRVVDVRHEATAVFAADASARLSGVPGVAVVTAGPGLTNTVTAIKNAQMAESPVVVIGGAAATMLKNRGSLQDIDQVSLLKSAAKECLTIDCVRDIAPTLREAFRLSQVNTPGPVFVEMPVDILYPYHIIAGQFASMSASKGPTKNVSLKTKLVNAYANYSLNHIFADAWKEQEYDPLPVTIKSPKVDELKSVANMLRQSKRPLLIMGSQSTLRPYGPECVANNVRKLGIPVYLNGAARGLLGSDYPLQFRHARKEAVREADCVILLGAICDFRLSYGRIFKKPTKVVSVNRSLKAAKLNAQIFWQPTIAIEADVGKFIEDLTIEMGKIDKKNDDSGLKLDIDQDWLKSLEKRDKEKDVSIENMALSPVEKNLNPLKLLLNLRKTFSADDTILVADGGDFVASASYIMKPCGPMRWLDPGPFGTLGCGAGFALAAKLLNPDKRVVAVMGDGAFGYAIPELDTFVRHKIPVYWIIGNDACWTQIAREQVPMLGSPIGCELAHTDYHKVAEGFGAKGYLLNDDSDLDERQALAKARVDNVESNQTVVVNAIIGKTTFRDGSISI